MKITILEPLAVEENLLREIFKSLTDKGHELIVYNKKAQSLEEEKKRVEDTDILVIANSPLKGEVIRHAKNLKYIAVAFTGVDHVDLEACREEEIKVSNAAGYSTASVAELAIGLILSIYRNIVSLDKLTRQGETKLGFRQIDLYGKTIGIVGTGAIGSHMAKISRAFGCKVLAYNRSENKELLDLGIEYMDLESLLRESDIVSLHLPLNEDTRHIIGKRELELMKKEAILINTARGPIIDSEALVKALDQKEILAVGIDVFDIEPPLNLDEPLLACKNAVLTPHIGFATEEAMVRRANITFDNIEAFLEERQENIVL